jgi:hypothetical protein
MPLLQETGAQLQNVKKFKIQLPLVVPDLVYTFQMICLRAAEVIEREGPCTQGYYCPEGKRVAGF